MKYALALAMVILVSAVLISGCTNQAGTGGSENGPYPGVQLTQSQKEAQAMAAVEQEMNQAIETATLQDIENELLQQG